MALRYIRHAPLVVTIVMIASSALSTKQPDRLSFCDNLPGYDVLPHFTVADTNCSSQGTIPVESAAAGSAVCDAESSHGPCNGFEYSRIDSAMRQLICTRPILHVPDKDVCLYTKITKAACNATVVKGYAKISDTQYTFTDPTWVEDAYDSVFWMLTYCMYDPECKAASYVTEPPPEYAYTLNNAGLTVTSRGSCSYFKLQSTTTKCKFYPGYDVLIDQMDVSPQQDPAYSSVPGGSNAAFAACNTDPKCNRFNSVGDLRTFSSSSSEHRGICTYIKVKQVCPIVPGYAPATDTDVVGSDIVTVKTILEAKRKCDASANCKAFNSKGTLKTVADGAAYKRGVCLFVKLDTECLTIPGYSAIPDTNVMNTTLKNFKKLEDAITFCDGRADCQGVSKLLGFIQAEPADKEPSYSRGACFYKKGSSEQG